jgi:beta-lactamase class A
MLFTSILASWCFLLITAAQPSKVQRAASVESEMRKAIAASGAEVSLALRPLDGHGEVLIDPDRPFHAASTMKVPVMIELYRQARSGALGLDDTLPIRNQFRSIVDGSPYALSEGDDSDKEIYAAVGSTLSLRQLCEAMIVTSSNFAANLLIDKLGADRIQRTVAALGADGMRVRRGVEDQKAFDKGLNNTTTARGLLILLDKLANGRAVDPSADAEMVNILKRQKFNDAIPAGLPPGITVAHKTGTITRIHHDAGIVYASRPYVLVVLVRGLDDQKQSAELIARLSRLAFEATQP